MTKGNKILDEKGNHISILRFIRILTGKEKKIIYIRNRGMWVSVLVLLKLVTKRFKVLYWTAENYSCYKVLKGMGFGIYIEHLIFTRFLRFIDVIICQTEYQHTQYLRNFNIDSILIRNAIAGVDENELDMDILERRYESNTYVWIGKLSVWKKRFDKLIEIALQYPDVTIKVIGPWKEVEDPEEIIGNLKAQGTSIPRNVHFFGKLSEPRCASIIGDSKFLISTSQQEGEGFPNTFLEAWKLGIPVFSLQFDPDQIIEKNELGIIDRFSRCLELSFNRYVQLSENSHRYCKTYHSIHNFNALLNVIQKIL
jgi:glycosyltransferase involved in cell wall biosynthesis